VAESVTSYLTGQILAGASGVQIFDTWGGNLSSDAYPEIFPGLHAASRRWLIREHEAVVYRWILFTRNGGLCWKSIARCGR